MILELSKNTLVCIDHYREALEDIKIKFDLMSLVQPKRDIVLFTISTKEDCIYCKERSKNNDSISSDVT